MRIIRYGLLGLAAALAGQGVCRAAVEPVGEPILELPTVRCLGVSWLTRGDTNHKATVDVQYREAGQEKWLQGPPLWRVGKTSDKTTKGDPLKYLLAQFEWQGGWAHPNNAKVIPADGEPFSGSILMLKPDTAYQIKLTLKGEGAPDVTKMLESKTIAEPVDPAGNHILHVAPGNGGGAGTKENPYKGLEAADAAAKPGDTFLLHAGKYQAPWVVSKSGEPGKPIIWRGAGDGEAVIDGMVADAVQKEKTADLKGELQTNFTAEQRTHFLTPRDVEIEGKHDVWLENLTIRNAQYALVAQESANIVVRHCHIDTVWSGIIATKNNGGKTGGFFISDNEVAGCTSWPKTTKIPDDCGIWVTGVCDVVCYNYVHNFGDGIQNYRGDYCEDMDVYNNDIRQCTDDGIEMKEVYRNVRVMDNRITNVLHPISIAPVFGGPEYLFRNVLYNMQEEPFKIHNSPSGVLYYNNTIVEAESTLGIWTPATCYNSVMRNNLLVANKCGKGNSNGVFTCDAKTVDCDFDYWGFAVGQFDSFLKWNGKHYKTLADAQKDGLFKHSLMFKSAGLFAAKVEIPKDYHDTYQPPDLRLAPNSPAVGAGDALPGFTEPGKPVDLGAYPVGCELPHYGPRPGK